MAAIGGTVETVRRPGSVPVQKSDTQQRFSVPQALRGLAALWVVLFHSHAGGHLPQFFTKMPDFIVWIFSRGEGGVAIFFALSGFVIAHSLRGRTPTIKLLGRFVLRRAIRLDPPYWAAIAVVICLGFVENTLGHGQAPIIDKYQIISHLFYAQTFFGFQNINIIFWTLCYEIQFYIFYVSNICIGYYCGKWGKIFIVSVHFLIAIIWASGRIANPVNGLFVDLWFAFYLGILSYAAAQSRFDALQMLVIFIPVALNQSFFAWIALLTAVFLAVSLATGYVKNGLRNPFLLFLGTISYSLYLLHNPITGAGFYVADMLNFPDIAAFIAVLAINIAAAWVFYRLIEVPSHAMSRKIKLGQTRGKGRRPRLNPFHL